MKTYTCRFDNEDLDKLTAIAEKQGRSVANLIRIIIKDYIKNALSTNSPGKSSPVPTRAHN